MRLEEIIEQAGMSPDPAKFVGRGAVTTDLNSAILYRIHSGIRHHYGEAASRSFVHLVETLPKLTARSFLENLYALEAQGWIWYDTPIVSELEIYRSDPPSSLLGTSQRDETNYIKADFLREFGSHAQPSAKDPFKW